MVVLLIFFLGWSNVAVSSRRWWFDIGAEWIETDLRNTRNDSANPYIIDKLFCWLASLQISSLLGTASPKCAIWIIIRHFVEWYCYFSAFVFFSMTIATNVCRQPSRGREKHGRTQCNPVIDNWQIQDILILMKN